VIANLKELYNKQANGFDRGFYKLLAKVDYNYEDINKLVKYHNMTRKEDKQISTKTKRLRERK